MCAFQRVVAVATLIVAAASTYACGDTISVGYHAYGQNFTLMNNGHSDSGGAGLFSLDYYGASIGDNFVRTTQNGTPYIASFCIDLKEYIWPAPHDNLYAIVSLADAPNYAGDPTHHMGTTKAKEIAQLWREYINPSANDWVSDPTNNSTKNAAFQLAVWEIVYEAESQWNILKTDSGNRGTFYSNRTPNGVETAAQGMLNWLATNPNAPQAELVAFSAPVDTPKAPGLFQDQVVELKHGHSTGQVPEPGSLVGLVGLALMLTGGGIRRRLRRA